MREIFFPALLAVAGAAWILGMVTAVVIIEIESGPALAAAGVSGLAAVIVGCVRMAWVAVARSR